MIVVIPIGSKIPHLIFQQLEDSEVLQETAPLLRKTI